MSWSCRHRRARRRARRLRRRHHNSPGWRRSGRLTPSWPGLTPRVSLDEYW